MDDNRVVFSKLDIIWNYWIYSRHYFWKMKKLLSIIIFYTICSSVGNAGITDIFKVLEDKTYTNQIFGIKIFDSVHNYTSDSTKEDNSDSINTEFKYQQEKVCPTNNCIDYPYARIPGLYLGKKSSVKINWKKNKLFAQYYVLVNRREQIHSIEAYSWLDDQQKVEFDNYEKCSLQKANLFKKIINIHKIPEEKLREENYSLKKTKKNQDVVTTIYQKTYVSYKVGDSAVTLEVSCVYYITDSHGAASVVPIETQFNYRLVSKKFMEFINSENNRHYERKEIDDLKSLLDFNPENTGL